MKKYFNMKINKLIFVGLIQIILVSCSSTKKEEVKSKEFVLSDEMYKTMEIVKSKYEPLRNQMNYFGEITTDNNKLIEIFPIVGGNVTKVYVELGDYVHKNQLLATIRSTEVAAFEKELEDAKNDVIVTKNNLKVISELYSGKINTERDLIEAKSEYEKALSQLERIKATYKIYNIKKGAIYEVKSPIEGFIIQKNINEKMLIRNDKTDNIFDVAEIDEVWAMANINESDISQVKLGVDAYVTTLSYPDKIFKGKVDKIYNIIDPETKAMKVRITLKNDEFLLKPDMRASIKLSYLENEQMICIPSSAIIFDKSKYFVMIYTNKHKIETRQVEVFREVNDKAYIENGLEAGEKIINKNQLLIYNALND